jgi:pyruvate formate lyase activating enzyme
MEEMHELRKLLADSSREGVLYRQLPNQWVLCISCGHRCKIGPGKEGICKIRYNREGKLFVPYGYVAGLQIDPIEKKPFFHVFPGCSALSFGMLGCDYHCGYCQNWITSQSLRDPDAGSSVDEVTPEEIIDIALRKKAKIVTSTYNEPLITSEWAVDIFKLAKHVGLITSYVSNGNGTREVIEFISPWVDLVKIDLKSFRQKSYAQLGGILERVLDTIRSLHEKGKWIEIVTLMVPGFNTSREELIETARFIRSVSSDIPWHLTAFHQDYKMRDNENTSASMLIEAVEIGYSEGLHFVYAGNMPGMTDKFENTFCWQCGQVLVERTGYHIRSNRIIHGKCSHCGIPIAGRWS